MYRTLVATPVLPNSTEKDLDQIGQKTCSFQILHFSPWHTSLLSRVPLLAFPHHSSLDKILFHLQDSDINTSKKSFQTPPIPQPATIPWSSSEFPEFPECTPIKRQQ